MEQSFGKMLLYGTLRNTGPGGDLGVGQFLDPVRHENLPGSRGQLGYGIVLVDQKKPPDILARQTAAPIGSQSSSRG